jgi:hypothetical protein
MNYTNLEQELLNHIQDRLTDGVITEDNLDDIHYHCFNEDYYIIGYYNAEQWINEHFDGAFEAINIVKEYEMDNFGEMYTDINSEAIANMLAYIEGEAVLNYLVTDTIEELQESLNDALGTSIELELIA